MGASVKQTIGASHATMEKDCADTVHSSARRSSVVKRKAAGAPLGEAATASDHAAIHQTLIDVFQGPDAAEFSAQQEDPLYEPCDRLIVKRRGRVAAHLQLTHRTWCFGAARIPVAGVHWLCTLPEMRGCGYAHALLEAADKKMRPKAAPSVTGGVIIQAHMSVWPRGSLSIAVAK